jgi:tetratricopeptide (TPR) repeat protein
VKMLKYIQERKPNAFTSWLLAGALLNDARWGDAQTTSPALKAAQKAVEAAPESPRAHFMLGAAQYFNKNIKAATEEFNQALKLAEDFAAPHFALADIALRQQDNLAAAKHLKAVLEMREPDDPEYKAAARKLKALQSIK